MHEKENFDPIRTEGPGNLHRSTPRGEVQDYHDRTIAATP